MNVLTSTCCPSFLYLVCLASLNHPFGQPVFCFLVPIFSRGSLCHFALEKGSFGDTFLSHVLLFVCCYCYCSSCCGSCCLSCYYFGCSVFFVICLVLCLFCFSFLLTLVLADFSWFLNLLVVSYFQVILPLVVSCLVVIFVVVFLIIL